MKCALALNVFATVCLFGIGEASDNAGIAEINSSKLTVVTIINDLSLRGKNLSSDLVTDQNEFKAGSLAFIGDVADMYTSEITSLIESAGKHDEHADNCLKLAKQSVQLNLKAINIDKCTKNALVSLDIVTKTIDMTIQYGNSIVNELDEIAKNCSSLEIRQIQNCVDSKLSKPRKSIEELQYNADRLKEINDSIFLPRERLACFENIVINFANDFELVKTTALKCIE